VPEYVTVARLQDALPLMADVALRPTFPEADLNRLHRNADCYIQAKDDSRVDWTIRLCASGLRHDASVRHAGDGSGSDTQSILDRRISVAFTPRLYQPANSTLIVVAT
jgi:predicted Zn-dependent peptidase